MLNTEMRKNGIIVTDDNGMHVATIKYDGQFWTVVFENDFDGRSRLDIVKAFRNREAANYYILAAYLEANG
jgi:hypothetical protein